MWRHLYDAASCHQFLHDALSAFQYAAPFRLALRIAAFRVEPTEHLLGQILEPLQAAIGQILFRSLYRYRVGAFRPGCTPRGAKSTDAIERRRGGYRGCLDHRSIKSWRQCMLEDGWHGPRQFRR